MQNQKGRAAQVQSLGPWRSSGRSWSPSRTGMWRCSPAREERKAWERGPATGWTAPRALPGLQAEGPPPAASSTTLGRSPQPRAPSATCPPLCVHLPKGVREAPATPAGPERCAPGSLCCLRSGPSGAVCLGARPPGGLLGTPGQPVLRPHHGRADGQPGSALSP